MTIYDLEELANKIKDLIAPFNCALEAEVRVSGEDYNKYVLDKTNTFQEYLKGRDTIPITESGSELKEDWPIISYYNGKVRLKLKSNDSKNEVITEPVSL